MNESESRAGGPGAQGPKALVGSIIADRYRLDNIIGEGGMGAVYSAEHLLIRKRVAVKVLHAEMTRLPEVVARFEREAMAAAHIEHPNVALASDFGKLDNGSFYLVLEHVEGRSLRDEMAAGPLRVERAVHVGAQILRALSRAHALGIVHRDLKPENVMLVERDGDKDFVKVLDFGIAKVPVGDLAPSARGPERDGSGPALTQVGMVYGTPEYMAPEQALGQEVDHRADLYALGVILFEMLAGKRPFDAANKVQILGMVVSKPVPRIAAMAPTVSVPAPLEEVVRTLLAKVASDRYADARTAIEALERASNEGASAPQQAAVADAKPAAGQGVDGLRRAAEPLISWARKLPEALRRGGPIERPPLVGFVGAGFVALLVGLIVVSVAFRSSRDDGGPKGVASATATEPIAPPTADSAAPPPSPSAPTDGEVRAATAEGVEALERLAGRAPDDKRVQRALAHALAFGKQWARGAAAYDALLSADPALVDEPEIRKDLTALAQADESADAAFTLLETKLGAAGADLLYEIGTDRQASQSATRRAMSALNQGRAGANASPALRTALNLRGASACQRKAYFASAKQHGDARSLPFLLPLQSTTGCGFLKRGDCYRCLRGDGTLYAAVQAILARRREGGAHE